MLNFISTMSIPDFKKGMGAEELEIRRNLITGKVYFICGSATGAVSDKFAEGNIENPVVSKVTSDDSGETFLMLHQKGESHTVSLALL